MTKIQNQILEVIDIKITICQQKPMGIDEISSFLDEMLMNEGSEKSDFVLFPEHFVTWKPDYVDLERNNYLKSVSEIVRKHGIYLILGTMDELRKENGEVKKFITSVVFEPSGQVLGTYSKNNIHRSAKEAGFSPGEGVSVFETKFGKISVLICLDSEVDETLNKVLEQEPRIVFIPICIPLPWIYKDLPDMVEASRITAFENMTNRFLPHAKKHNTIFARADSPRYEDGGGLLYGTSLIITPEEVVEAPTMEETNFSVNYKF